jgi:hypothetical protein
MFVSGWEAKLIDYIWPGDLIRNKTDISTIPLASQLVTGLGYQSPRLVSPGG